LVYLEPARYPEYARDEFVFIPAQDVSGVLEHFHVRRVIPFKGLRA